MTAPHDTPVVVVDTNVLIDVLRGHSPAVRAMEERMAAGEILAVSVLSRFEILAGARVGEMEQLGALLASLETISVDVAIADRAGELARAYGRSHAGIDAIDYLIAASVALVGGELLTQNVKHFPMIPGLQAAYVAVE